MNNARRKVLWFAVCSRLLVIFMQFIFNVFCPDHNADAFKTPSDTNEEISIFDIVINYLFGGLVRWDGQYFVHIAKYGYTYENTLAFYPLYPITTRIISVIFQKLFFMINMHSAIILTAVLINFACFVKSAVIFYDLSKTVLHSTGIAYKAAILYCINPASIFFSAAYSESMFAYLTFYSMLESIKYNQYVFFPIGLSMLVRSNGLVNIGFPLYFEVKDLYHTILNVINCNKQIGLLKVIYKLVASTIFIKKCFRILSILIISLSPFLLLQIYNYINYCTFHSINQDLPQHVIQYAVMNNLILPGINGTSWCHNHLPIAYSYIQERYWNVGFMKYYELKQIPNFILALPVLYIMLSCVKEFFVEHRNSILTMGIFESTKKEDAIGLKKYPADMIIFVAHGLFLTVFCILFVHIQVSTRLLCSASPLMYWYCALVMSSKCSYEDAVDVNYECMENLSSKWKVFFLSQKKYTVQDKIILSYYLGYTVVGSFMFSNFLPWT